MILGSFMVRGEFVGGTDLHQRISTNYKLWPLARRLSSFDTSSNKVSNSNRTRAVDKIEIGCWAGRIPLKWTLQLGNLKVKGGCYSLRNTTVGLIISVGGIGLNPSSWGAVRCWDSGAGVQWEPVIRSSPKYHSLKVERIQR
jgi:hypothetical protein